MAMNELRTSYITTLLASPILAILLLPSLGRCDEAAFVGTWNVEDKADPAKPRTFQIELKSDRTAQKNLPRPGIKGKWNFEDGCAVVTWTDDPNWHDKICPDPDSPTGFTKTATGPGGQTNSGIADKQ